MYWLGKTLAFRDIGMFGLDWARLGWVGLGWIGLDWAAFSVTVKTGLAREKLI